MNWSAPPAGLALLRGRPGDKAKTGLRGNIVSFIVFLGVVGDKLNTTSVNPALVG